MLTATVRLKDGTSYTVKELLGDGDSNHKLLKSDKANKGFLTVGLSLSPANESGYEMCASRSPGCTRACLNTSGLGQMRNVQTARIAKTILFMEQRDTFLKMLYNDLIRAGKRAYKANKLLACRLNVYSDVVWEKIFPSLFTDFVGVQFYDYTKHAKRAFAFARGELPRNYHLTFSRSETNWVDVAQIVQNTKCNVAVVFAGQLPEKWMTRRVINGDNNDLRFLDPRGVIVGLVPKGRGRKDTSGFVVSREASPAYSLPVLNGV